MPKFEIRSKSLTLPYEVISADNFDAALGIFLSRNDAKLFECFIGTNDITNGANVIVPVNKSRRQLSDQEHLFEAWLGSLPVEVSYHPMSVLLEDWADSHRLNEDDDVRADLERGGMRHDESSDALFFFADFIAYRYGNIDQLIDEGKAKYPNHDDFSEKLLSERFIPKIKTVYASEIAELGYVEKLGTDLKWRIVSACQTLNVFGTNRDFLYANVEDDDPLTTAFRRSGWGL